MKSDYYLRKGRQSKMPDADQLLAEFDAVPLRMLAGKYGVSIRTVQRWLAKARTQNQETA